AFTQSIVVRSGRLTPDSPRRVAPRIFRFAGSQLIDTISVAFAPVAGSVVTRTTAANVCVSCGLNGSLYAAKSARWYSHGGAGGAADGAKSEATSRAAGPVMVRLRAWSGAIG